MPCHSMPCHTMPFHAMPWTASTAPGLGHDERLLDGAGPRPGPRALAASSESAHHRRREPGPFSPHGAEQHVHVAPPFLAVARTARLIQGQPAHLDQGIRDLTSWVDGSAGPRRFILLSDPPRSPISLAGSGALVGDHTHTPPTSPTPCLALSSSASPLATRSEILVLRVHLYMRAGLLLSTNPPPRSETSCSGSHDLLRR